MRPLSCRALAEPNSIFRRRTPVNHRGRFDVDGARVVGQAETRSPELRSEPAIVAAMAIATLPESNVDWLSLVADYDRIRDLIEQTIPGFDQYNQRIRHPGGFRMPLPPTERIWPTPTGKAMFSVFHGVHENQQVAGHDVMRLVTLRSTISTTPPFTPWTTATAACLAVDVLFMNEQDMAEQGFEHGDRVDISSALPGHHQRLEDITLVAYSIAPGTVAAYYPEANVLVLWIISIKRAARRRINRRPSV